MSQITIGESIRTRLEPHNNGMQLAQRANTGMVDMVVDNICCNGQVEGGIDTVCKCDEVPCCAESS
jgi:hypothetical protein